MYGDLGEIVAGTTKAREHEKEIIVHTHFGTGSLDVAVAQIAYKKAMESGSFLSLQSQIELTSLFHLRKP